LLCRIGGRFSGLPLDHVVEVMRPLPLEPVAEVRPFVRGMSIVRGEPVLVVDARRLLDGREAASGGRLVALRVGTRSVALHVDDVVGVRVIARELLQEVPPLLGDATDARVAIGTLDGRLLELLDSARLLPGEPELPEAPA
jgi:purine-binding chemotaxis protein CheW